VRAVSWQTRKPPLVKVLFGGTGTMCITGLKFSGRD